MERYKDNVKRADRRAGGVIAMLYNINRDVERDPGGLDWDDFFAEWKLELRQTDDEMYDVMRSWANTGEGLIS